MTTHEQNFVGHLQQLVEAHAQCDYVAAVNFQIPKAAKTAVLLYVVRQDHKAEYDALYKAKIDAVSASYAVIYRAFPFSEARAETYNNCSMYWFPFDEEGHFLHFVHFGHANDSENNTFVRAVLESLARLGKDYGLFLREIGH